MPLTKGTENLRRDAAIRQGLIVDKSKQQKYKHRNITSLNFRGSPRPSAFAVVGLARRRKFARAENTLLTKVGSIQNSLETSRAYGGCQRHGMPMKDAATCEKPRLGGKQPLTRGYPNEETHLEGSSRYLALNI